LKRGDAIMNRVVIVWFALSFMVTGMLISFDYNDPRVQKFMERHLGSPKDKVFHAAAPFDSGRENGGAADVYLFNRKDGYISYVTGDLIGKVQPESDAGNYELLIVMKDGEEWGENLIRMLAFSTLEESFNSGETMDLGEFGISVGFPALIFDKYADTQIDGKQIGVMLVVGITQDELEWKMKNGGPALLKKLKAERVYPYSIPNRKSILE
jgi:hypothetical protein